MELSFWLGLALAIPIGIGASLAANLLTPHTQRLLARFSERRAAKLTRRRKEVEARARRAAASPAAYTIMLIVRLHLTLMTIVAAAVAGSTLLIAASFTEGTLSNILYLVAELWVGVIFLIMTRLTVRSVETAVVVAEILRGDGGDASEEAE